jgi:hypothetical protein
LSLPHLVQAVSHLSMAHEIGGDLLEILKK